MKIIGKKGNLLTASEKIILHSCNAKGVMGAGVAKDIRAIYPLAYKTYREEFKKNGLTLGQSIWVDCGRHVVISIIGQANYGKDPNVVYVDYNAIRTAFRDIDKVCQALDGVEIALPLIGCGLANGDWNVISSIIEQESNHFQPFVYIR